LRGRNASYQRQGAFLDRKDASYEEQGGFLCRKDACYERQGGLLCRKDASYERQDASYEGQGASYERKDASYERKDASYEGPGASYKRKDAPYERQGGFLCRRIGLLRRQGAFFLHKLWLLRRQGALLGRRITLLRRQGALLRAKGTVLRPPERPSRPWKDHRQLALRPPPPAGRTRTSLAMTSGGALGEPPRKRGGLEGSSSREGDRKSKAYLPSKGSPGVDVQRLMRDSASNRAATLELPTHLSVRPPLSLERRSAGGRAYRLKYDEPRARFGETSRTHQLRLAWPSCRYLSSWSGFRSKRRSSSVRP
jgi:hypothetical protein